MNRITIDQPTKLALEYVEKLRDSLSRKRQRLSDTSSAVRPSEIPGISTQKLSDVLLRFAYNGTYVDEFFRDHIIDLVIDRSLSWDQVINSIMNTKTDKLYTKCQMCELVREMIHFVQVKSFDDKTHADTLIEMLQQIVFFLTQLILDLLAEEDELENIQIDNEDPCKPYQKPLDALNTLIHDDLCSILLTVNDPSEVTEQLEYCLDAFMKLENPDKHASTLMELLFEKHVENCKPTEYEYVPEGLARFDLKNPSVRILIPIFACYKPHESSKSIAATIQTVAEIMKVSGEDVIFDLLHAAVLLKCEESMDFLHLPKHHRIDFRWQSTTFFYKKLPQIIGCLIGEGKVTNDDVLRGLNKALNDLSMMFDAADATWQNASFLTLLNELEPTIGKELIDPLRQRRRDHMKTTPNLTALAETDNNLIENTEVDKLLTAVKEVMHLQFGQSDEFWKIFLDKITSPDRDDFDAVTSILTAEGKLLEAGNAYSLKNLEAQEPSMIASTEERIRNFNDTFLLLSRIVICTPHLSIGLFVNGGRGKTEAERTIFYKWSMWFVKRVERKSQQEWAEHLDLETRRKEVEMLMKLANAEVGIENGEEEEEDIVEDVVEQIKKGMVVENAVNGIDEGRMEESEMQRVEGEEGMSVEPRIEEQLITEPAEDGIEKMDTSEVPVESNDMIDAEMKPTEPTDKQVVKPPDGPKENVEAAANQNRKKSEEIPPVTWKEVHCPLPRITKKVGRIYLSQLKEGHQFWSKDDQSLNIGSIVAAIPIIGKLLVEEHEEKQRHRIDRKAAEEHMTNILHAIDSMPCLFICLTQWLDCEKDSPARTSLAITMKASLEKRILSLSASSSASFPQWRFVQSTVQTIIDELTGKKFAFPEVSLTLFSAARRFCPSVSRNEKPDNFKLKHVWHFMRQQAWASPHALRILQHANTAGEYNSWSHLYMNKTIKTGCGDLMKSSIDMIFSFLMMDDLNSIIRIHESLMEFWLNEDATQCQLDGRFEPLAMRAVIRLMSHVMLMAEWRLDRLVNDGPPLPDPLPLTEPINTPEPEDPLYREKWVFLLRLMLDRTVNRFFKILRNGLLLSVVNTIIQLIKSIAGAADCRAKRLLVRRIPPSLIFQLAYIEPTSVDYSLMNVFCDPENEEHTRTKVMFLCAVRRANVL
ncbi:unnamed protein product [Caenorhabditis brenneri]